MNINTFTTYTLFDSPETVCTRGRDEASSSSILTKAFVVDFESKLNLIFDR